MNPNSLQLFMAMSACMKQVSGVFEFSSKPVSEIRDWVQENPNVYDLKAYPSETIITFFQVILLASLSFHQGILVPLVKQVLLSKRTISVSWTDGKNTNFKVGVADQGFLDFFAVIEKQVFELAPRSAKVEDCLKKGMVLMEEYRRHVEVAKTQLKGLHAHQNHLASLLDSESSMTFIFTLIAALPEPQLNALFLYVQQFLPEELEVQNYQGNKITVASMFETPSTDIRFLNEKISVYLHLYRTADKPIIREITQTKTKEYLLELVRNKAVLAQVMTHIDETIAAIFDPFINLYTLLHTWLNRFFNGR